MTEKRITIIGLGLIGGSLGLALKESMGSAVTITGFTRRAETAAIAERIGAVDRTAGTIQDAVSGADIVILATPVLAMEGIFRDMSALLAPGVIVSDVGSTKAQIIEWAKRYLPAGTVFIGGHPMTGKERSGIEQADGSLFRDAVYCLTPPTEADGAAVETLEALIRAIGARPLLLDAALHDRLVGGVSHLPLLISVALAGMLGRNPLWPEMAALAASGYRDTTRLASGDPDLHYGICATNRETIARWLDRYIEELSDLRRRLRDEPRSLLEALRDARRIREQWLREEGRRFRR